MQIKLYYEKIVKTGNKVLHKRCDKRGEQID